MRRIPTLLALALLVGGCLRTVEHSRPAFATGEGLLLVHGGRIYVDARSEPVEALLIEDGRVALAGPERRVARGLPPGVRRVDLRGATAVPGLQDAHGHVVSYGESLESVDLTACGSYAELVERVRSQAGRQAPGTWVTGRGWDQSLWAGNAFPHHAELSAAVPDHPVLVRRVDGHAALANARALGLAGLETGTIPEVSGGEIHVDEAGGPTGVLIDAAIGLVARYVPAPDAASLRRRILRAQDALLAQGITCVHDMGLSEAELAVLEELDEEGALVLRVVGYLWGNEGLAPGLAERYPDAPEGRLRVAGVKLMLDGALGSRGAALLADYHDRPGEQGHLLVSPEVFAQLVDAAADAGLQPATHAIGDRANRVLLEAYAARLARDPGFARLRPRVEHAQVVAPEDLARFAELGVVRSMQPTHATTDMRWAEARLGPTRLRGAYAWRRLADDPGTLAFGSDFPVEDPRPLRGLYAARFRRDAEGRPADGWMPDQRLDAREALAAFTSGAAYAAGDETSRGRLRPGYFADLSVFDVDPVTAPADRLLAGRCVLTVVEGRAAHRTPDGPAWPD